jgi:hypothetical protein
MHSTLHVHFGLSGGKQQEDVYSCILRRLVILYALPRIARAITLQITLRVVRLSRMNREKYEWDFNGGEGGDRGSNFKDVV